MSEEVKEGPYKAVTNSDGETWHIEGPFLPMGAKGASLVSGHFKLWVDGANHAWHSRDAEVADLKARIKADGVH